MEESSSAGSAGDDTDSAGEAASAAGEVSTSPISDAEDSSSGVSALMGGSICGSSGESESGVTGLTSLMLRPSWERGCGCIVIHHPQDDQMRPGRIAPATIRNSPQNSTLA